MREKVILYDAECSLCCSVAAFIQRADGKNAFSFVPLQTGFATELLSDAGISQKGLNSMVFLDKGEPVIKSTAVFRIARELGGFYKIINLLQWFPDKLADRIYDWVAVNRFKWFGKPDKCNCLTQAEK